MLRPLLFGARIGLVFVLIVVLAVLPPVLGAGLLVLVGGIAVGAAYDAVPTPLGITLVVVAVVLLRGSFPAIRVACLRSVTFRRIQSWLVSLTDQVYYDRPARAWAYRSSEGATRHYPSRQKARAFAAWWAARRQAAARKPLPTEDRRPCAPRHAKKDQPTRDHHLGSDNRGPRGSSFPNSDQDAG